MNALDSKYLHPADLHRLRRLFFASRRAATGRHAGRHPSPRRGRGIEFNDYRPFLPGDSPVDVDWKIYGRSDRLYLKLFEHQSDMTVNLLVDGSASMAYGGDARGETTSKFDHAARLAAAVAFLAIQQRDRVSLGIAQDGLRTFLHDGQSANHLIGILRALEQTNPTGAADLPGALRKMIGEIPRRGLLLVCSDLLDDQEQVFAALALYIHRGGQVAMFHVLHAEELQLPRGGETLFLDSESAERVSINTEELRAGYATRIRQFIAGWSAGCARRAIDYRLVSTATPYHRVLEQYLHSRTGRR